LLVSAREPAHVLLGTGAADVERLDHLERVAPYVAPVEQAQRLERSGAEEAPLRLDRGERDVELDALVGKDAHAAPILGDEREPAVNGGARILWREAP